MQTRNVSPARKFLYGMMVVGILVSLLGGNLTSASAQEGIDVTLTVAFSNAGDICLLSGTVELSEQEAAIIKDAIYTAQDSVDFNRAECFAAIDRRDEQEWSFITLVGLTDAENDSNWTVSANGVWSDNAIIHFVPTTHAAIAGTMLFSEELNSIPNEIVSEDSKKVIDPLADKPGISQSATSSFRFPFELGYQVYYGIKDGGVHPGEFIFTGGMPQGSLAVDLMSDGNTGANHAPNRLYAAWGGTVVKKCSDTSKNSTYIIVDDGSQRFLYAHIKSSTAPGLWSSVNQGSNIGEMATGDFNDNPCGYANQLPSFFHVHFEFPATTYLTLSDWTLNTSSEIWTRGNEAWPSGQWRQVGSGGGACPAPSLNNPSDGYVSSNQTITFSWSALSGCTFNGYTFRIKDTSNMDSGGSTIVDTDEGGTSRTETIGTQWNNRDLWWGVRAANAPNGASWSVRRFRIEPGGGGCPTLSGEVRVYDATNCGGSYATANGTGLWTLVPNFNDMAESIAIPSGWSARLYLHDSESSPSACFGGTDTDLWNNSFSDGTTVANQATWMRVYGNTTCTGSTPPNAPSLNSPSNGQYFNEGESITLSWSATGSEYYGEVWGGPGGTLTFGWQTGTSKNIGSQWAGYTYSWHVKAKNSSGESAWSETRTFTVRPGAPSNLSASAVSCNQINLSWNDNSGNEEGYKVYRNGSLIATLGSGTTSYQSTGLSGNTSYSYVVKAYRGSIESNASNTASATTQTCTNPPGAFNKISPSNSATGVSTSPTLSWGASSNATGYYYCIDTSNNNNCDTGWQSVGTATSKALSGLTAGDTYYWQVRANNSIGERFANDGTWWSFTTQTSPNPINILYNGGFEEGYFTEPWAYPYGWQKDAWIMDRSTFIWDSTQKYSGNRSVKITNNITNDARWIQLVYVQPNSDYRLSGWIKTDNIDQSRGDRGANLSYGTFQNTPYLNGTKDWTFVSVEFNTGSKTQITIAARLGMDSGDITGTAWFDDLKLELLSDPVCYTLSTSVLPNGGGSVMADPPPNCPNGTQYVHGTTVNLLAIPNSGYHLSSWTGVVHTYENPTPVLMTSNKNVIANFAVNNISSTITSTASHDGYILESTETSGTGGTMDATATTFNLGDAVGDKQYRVILHFDTSALPDNAVITSAVLKIKKQGLSGTDPFNILGALRVDMRKPAFGTPALALSDFKSRAGRNNVASFGATPIGRWYSAILNNAGRVYISRTGTTQFRIYFVIDDNDDNGADFMKFYSGNAGVASRPKLVIEYYVP